MDVKVLSNKIGKSKRNHWKVLITHHPFTDHLEIVAHILGLPSNVSLPEVK